MATVLHIRLVDPPTAWAEHPHIVSVLLLRDGGAYRSIPSADHSWEVTLDTKVDRSGETQWTGPAVVHHGDGRRFIYLGWISDPDGAHHMFRRLKIYLSSIPGLTFESDRATAKVVARGADGSPACATARLVP